MKLALISACLSLASAATHFEHYNQKRNCIETSTLLSKRCEPEPSCSDEPQCGNGINTVDFSVVPLLVDQGGRKLSSPKIYLQFYGNGTYWDTTTKDFYIDALTAVGTSSYYSPVVALSGVGAPVFSGDVVFGNATSDLASFAAQQGVANSMSNGNTTTNNIPRVVNGMYLLLVDPNFSNGTKIKSGTGSSMVYDDPDPSKGFCGYHSGWNGLGGTGNPLLGFALVGTNGSLCQWATPTGMVRPNSGHRDMATSVLIHEISEMSSNPDADGYNNGPGWGLEYGDFCAGFVESGETTGSGELYNATFGTTKFLLQAQYVSDGTTHECKNSAYTS